VGKQWETFKVKGEDLIKLVKRIIHEGNVRRVIVRQGSRTVGVVGAAAAPVLAAIGAVAALLTECTIEVERAPGPAPRAAPPRRASAGGRRRGNKA